MKQKFYLRMLLASLLIFVFATNVSAQTQTYFSCNFDNYTNISYLTSNGWTTAGTINMNSNSPYRYGDQGRAVQLGTKNGASGTVTTPVLSTDLPSNVSLSFYTGTGKYDDVTLTVTVLGGGAFLNSDNSTSESIDIAVTKSGGKIYSYNLTGCTSATKIKFEANKIAGLDNVVVTDEVNQKTHVTLSFSPTSFTTPTEEGVVEGTPELTVNPAAAAEFVTFSSSDESVATVDAQTGVVTAVSPGTITITASISDNETYIDASVYYTLKVGLSSSNLNYNPTSVTVTYDKKDNFTAPTLSYASGYNGTITYTSSNPSVATVGNDEDNKGKVTILAVGETTITASGAATENLKASEASFTLTVNDIQGSATGGGNGESIFKETFDQTNGTGGSAEGLEGSWKGSIATSNIYTDEEGWSFYSDKNGAYKCIRQGASGGTDKKGFAMTRYINVEIGKTYTLTFKAAPWSNESAKMIVSVTEGCTIDGISEDDMTPYYWNNYTATITPNTVSQIRIKFEASQNRFFLDEINVVAPSADNTVQVTIPSSGWGTYCCQWPLDFTAASVPEGLKAYAVSSTSSSNATLTEITEKIIGGTGILINGTPGETYTINVADQGAAYSGTNLLTGTLAPTYVEEGQYFLKSGKFVYSSAGTLPANKAYLKSANAPEAAANLAFVFVESTGISEVHNNISLDDDKWYDLSGRVVSPTSKGIYIHNGKKYVIK